MLKPIYIFIDEGGNFDFSANGSSYFTFTCLVKEKPFLLNPQIENLKYDLIEKETNLEYFHASNDRQFTRNHFFELLNKNLQQLDIYSLIVDKRKTNPSIRDVIKFYPKMLGYLLKYVIDKINFSDVKEVIVITDDIPINRKRKAVEKGIKETLKRNLPQNCKYTIFHHSSKSHYTLQATDYCNWAIQRKWERGDSRSYDIIKGRIKSEFNIFKESNIIYY